MLYKGSKFPYNYNKSEKKNTMMIIFVGNLFGLYYNLSYICIVKIKLNI